MKYQEAIDYTIPCDQLLAIFSRPDFVLAKYQAQGARNIRLLREDRTGTRFSVTVARDVPVQIEVPSFARSLVPPTITLVQTNSWDIATRTGYLDIEFKNMPVILGCAMHLEERPTGAHHTLNSDIKVNVPLIGGKLEKLLAEDLQMKFKSDTEVSLRLIKNL